MEYDREFLTGTVGVLILSLLTEREMYGYEIVQEAERRSARTLQLKEGTVYPALHRLEKKKWIAADWKLSENNQRVKVYRLTAAGRRQLSAERSWWIQLLEAHTHFHRGLLTVRRGYDGPHL